VTPLNGGFTPVTPPIHSLAVCCASRVKPSKIDFQSIFYSVNCVQTKGLRSPIIGDFLRHQAQKIHKCNRLLSILNVFILTEKGGIINETTIDFQSIFYQGLKWCQAPFFWIKIYRMVSVTFPWHQAQKIHKRNRPSEAAL
jgi:hypothetical protein